MSAVFILITNWTISLSCFYIFMNRKLLSQSKENGNMRVQRNSSTSCSRINRSSEHKTHRQNIIPFHTDTCYDWIKIYQYDFLDILASNISTYMGNWFATAQIVTIITDIDVKCFKMITMYNWSCSSFLEYVIDLIQGKMHKNIQW